jgi:hypothetical protein
MAHSSRAEVGCLFVGEFVEEPEVPTDRAFHRGEVLRPQLVASYLDMGSVVDEVREFTVLLRDSRVITVSGSGLKYVQNAGNPSDYGSYAVLAPSAGGAVIVALFRVSEVTGIFSGDMQRPRESA